MWWRNSWLLCVVCRGLVGWWVWCGGTAETAFQSIETLIRTRTLALEKRSSSACFASHPIFGWLVEFCADVYKQTSIGGGLQDCSPETETEKNFRQTLFECESSITSSFCGQGSTLGGRWFEGIFLGEKSHSEEYVVMRESGHVVKGRAVRAAAREVSLTDRDWLVGESNTRAGTLRGVVRDEGRLEPR